MFDAAHIAGLIAGGAHPNPVPHADVVTFTTHKTLRGPRGGCILATAELGPAIDKAIFPGLQGGPLEHVIAAKAVAFREAAHPSFRDYAAQIVRNADAAGRGRWPSEGFRLVSGGTDNHLLLRRPAGLRRRADRQGGPDRARPGRHHAQQEHHPRRPALAVRDQRRAHRHAGGHHPGHGRAGDGADRRRSSPGRCATATTTPSWPSVRDEVATLCSKFTPYA